jgi:hypothetical protein
VDHPRLEPDDRALIAELLARYAEAIDAGDFAAVGGLLCDAEILDGEGNRIAAGAGEVTALYEAVTKVHADGTPRTAHVITNVVIDLVAPDVVEMRSRFTVFQATERLPLQAVVVGRYIDRVERLRGEWRFVSRSMLPEAWGEVGEHLRIPPPDGALR